MSDEQPLAPEYALDIPLEDARVVVEGLFQGVAWNLLAHHTASTGLGNSASTESPADPNILPRCSAITLSMIDRQTFRVAKVPVSSLLMSFEYPTTSAARMVVSLRSTLGMQRPTCH